MKTRPLLFVMLFCLFSLGAYCQETWIYPPNFPQTNVEIGSILVDSTHTKMYIGNYYPYISGSDSSCAIVWDGTNWSLLGKLLGSPINGGIGDILSMAYYQNYIYACGLVNSANGQLVAQVAKYNGTKWEGISGSQPNEGGGGDNTFYYMQVYRGKLYMVGGFGNVVDTLGGPSGLHTGNLASWDGQYWDTVGGVFNGADGIYSLAVYKNELYVGGMHLLPPHISGGDDIYKWNDTIWSPVGNNVSNYTDTVYSMAVMDGKLYVAGTFTSINGQAANNIAVWDGSTWDSLGAGMNKDIITLYADTANHILYAGGRFTTAGGKPANNIAFWDGSQWNAMGQGMNNYVYTINKFQGSIYAAGFFTTADGHPCNNIAYWGCCTGVNELQNKSEVFNLYPNPNNGNMTLEYNLGASDKGELDLYDFTGRQLKTYILNAASTTMEINESNLSNGIYFYRVLVNNSMLKADKLVIIK